VREIINRYARIRAHHEAVLKTDATLLFRPKRPASLYSAMSDKTSLGKYTATKLSNDLASLSHFYFLYSMHIKFNIYVIDWASLGDFLNR
jgi:hypothetical protein